MRIARDLIDPDADKVVRRLARHGFQAYLVGGCVRDLLLSRTPKDFDVATNATPKEIKQLFRNCRIIGRRFRLAHVFFGAKIIETSTFRANPRDGEDVDESDELLIRRDNVFGTEIEDARRRDFTINGLFYDVEAERVIDHVGGLDDLDRRVVRTIGDPDIRFREDPVRILRAVKFAARLAFDIEPDTFAQLIRHRGEIAKCPQPRVLEELYRLLRSGAARRSMTLLVETGVSGLLSPHLTALLGPPPAEIPGERSSRDQDVGLAGAIEQDPFEVDLDAPEDDGGNGGEGDEPAPVRSMAVSRSRPSMEARRPVTGRPNGHAAPVTSDEDEWAAVWSDDAVEGGASLRGAAMADDGAVQARGSIQRPEPLPHDHELEDIHDPDEEADVQAERRGELLLPDDADTSQDLDALIDLDTETAEDAAADEDDDEDEDDEDDEDDDDDDEDGELDLLDEEDEEEEEQGPGYESRRDGRRRGGSRPPSLLDARDDDGKGSGHGSPDGDPSRHRSPSFGTSLESMAARRALAWAMLDQLDDQFRRGEELSNSLLLAALCTPFVFDDLLENGIRPLEANDLVLEVLHPLVTELQVARRDAERTRQILLAQRRLAPARRRRGKPMSLVRRDFFPDALHVYRMMSTVGGHDVSDLTYWTKLHSQGSTGERTSAGPGDELRSGKRRRRRRGGRRRRRTPAEEDQGGEREPALGR